MPSDVYDALNPTPHDKRRALLYEWLRNSGATMCGAQPTDPEESAWAIILPDGSDVCVDIRIWAGGQPCAG